ncbi:MAG: GGDEF domain-containing protein [Actinomycetota bacterium]
MTATQARGGFGFQRTDPLSREALFRQVGSLVGAALLGLLSFAMRQVSSGSASLILQASTLTAATVIATLLVPWERLPSILHRLMPLAYVVVAYMTAQATGGIESSYAQLVLLPVLWVAVYGSGLELVGALAAAAVALGASVLASGSVADEWPRLAAMMTVGASLGLVVNRFFSRIRTETSTLQVLAGTDPLTGAANRRAWDEALDTGLMRAARDGRPLSVALLDLDDFKGYNDRYGHQAGDVLLKVVSAAWQNQLRASDILARIGGDEFGVLLPGCHLEMAATIAERLRRAVPEAKCSVGVATWDGSEAAGDLFARTDAALYEAKEMGRDRVVVLADVADPMSGGSDLQIP